MAGDKAGREPDEQKVEHDDENLMGGLKGVMKEFLGAIDDDEELKREGQAEQSTAKAERESAKRDAERRRSEHQGEADAEA